MTIYYICEKLEYSEGSDNSKKYASILHAAICYEAVFFGRGHGA